MGKIYGRDPQDAIFCGLNGDYKKNTEIVVPSGHFGILHQYDIAQVFTSSIKLNKKAVSGLDVPFLFGKVKRVFAFFYPYGFSGNFNAPNQTFTASNGRKVKVSFEAKYQVEIDSRYRAIEFNKKYGKFYPTNGTIINNNDFAKLLVEHILEKAQHAFSKAETKKDWYTPYEGEIRRPWHVIGLETEASMAIKEFFTDFGYKVKSDSVKITAMKYID